MNSFVTYKSMLGITDIESDVMKVDTLAADTVITNHLQLPNGAISNYVLKTDKDGNASWKPISLAGDITGGETTTVNTTKWIGNWNPQVSYMKNNLVTHNHIVYRALSDNISAPPEENSIMKQYSMYNENYPRPEPTTGYPDMEWHREISINLNPKVQGKLTHYRFYKAAENTQTSIRLRVSTPIGPWEVNSSWETRHDRVYPVVQGWNEIELTDPVPLRIGVPNVVFYSTEGQPFTYDGESPVYTKADPEVVVVTDMAAGVMTWVSPGNNYKYQREDQAPNGGAHSFSYLMDFVFKHDQIWEVVL